MNFKKKKKEPSLRNRTQDLLLWKELYQNGLIELEDNTYALMMRFDNAPYLSRTETEQNSLYEAYTTTLNGLSPLIHYQELIYSRPINSAELKELMLPSADVKDSEFGRDFKKVLTDFADNIAVNIARQSFIAVISARYESKLSDPYKSLYKTYTYLAERFEKLGSKLTVMLPDEILKTMYVLHNPFSSGEYKEPSDLYAKGLNPKDIVAPGGVSFKPKWIELEDGYSRSFAVTAYGGVLDDTFFTDLTQINASVLVTKHVDHIAKDVAIKQIEKRSNSLYADMDKREKDNHRDGGSYIPLNLKRNIEACEKLIDRLMNSDDLFEISVLITVNAKSKEELEELSAVIKSKASEHFVTLKPMVLKQQEGFLSVMPYGINKSGVSTVMLSSEASVMTPFSFPTLLDEGGLFYGINVRSGEPLVIDRKMDKNANGFVFGKSGGGKSFFVKLEQSALLWSKEHENDSIIVVDPDGEFVRLANEHAAQSEVIPLAAKSEKVLNPFELSDFEIKAYGLDSAIHYKTGYIVAFIEAVKGDALTAIEKTVIDRAITAVYGAYNQTAKIPTLESFYNTLATFGEEEAVTLRLYLERYVKGSVTLFNGEGNVRTDKQYTVFDMTLLGDELKEIGMLAVITAIRSKLFENVSKSYHTWVYFDELHRYYRHSNGFAAKAIEQLYAECRKYGGIVTAMTQHPKSVLSSPAAESMLANSQFIVAFELDGDNVDSLADRLKLNDSHKKLLVSSDVGQAVLHFKNNTISVRYKFPKNNVVYNTLTTDIKDKA